MTPNQVRTILDALEYTENKYLKQLEREPRTRGGKPNPMVPYLQKELDAIADAHLAFRYAKIELTQEA